MATWHNFGDDTLRLFRFVEEHENRYQHFTVVRRPGTFIVGVYMCCPTFAPCFKTACAVESPERFAAELRFYPTLVLSFPLANGWKSRKIFHENA